MPEGTPWGQQGFDDGGGVPFSTRPVRVCAASPQAGVSKHSQGGRAGKEKALAQTRNQTSLWQKRSCCMLLLCNPVGGV